MRPATLLFASVLLLCARADSPGWQVSARSIGPVCFGMTLAAASQALGEPLTVDTVDGGCGYVASRRAPAGIGLMAVGERIVRVAVDSVGITTTAGAHVGSTEAEIRRLYPGQIKTTPHEYDGPEWHYLSYLPQRDPDRGFGIVFETDGHRVVGYRAGEAEAVQWVEGCL